MSTKFYYYFPRIRQAYNDMSIGWNYFNIWIDIERVHITNNLLLEHFFCITTLKVPSVIVIQT